MFDLIFELKLFYFIAIRSGDYYMFEFPDDDIDLELSARHRRVEEDDEDSAEVKEKGLNAVNYFSPPSLFFKGYKNAVQRSNFSY